MVADDGEQSVEVGGIVGGTDERGAVEARQTAVETRDAATGFREDKGAGSRLQSKGKGAEDKVGEIGVGDGFDDNRRLG